MIITKEINTFDAFRYCLYNEGINDDFLDNYASHIIDSGKLNFEEGVLGLGWLIGYLIEHKYIDENPDEVLEDIDDNIYKLCIKEIVQEAIDVDKLLYFVNYYQQRIAFDSSESIYRRFVHMECMKLLVAKLNVYILNISLRDKYDVVWLTKVLLKYSFLSKSIVNESLIEEAYYSAVESLLDFYEKMETLDKYEVTIAKFYYAVKLYDHPDWENRLKSLIDTFRPLIINIDAKKWLYLAEHAFDSFEEESSDFYLDQLKQEVELDFLFEYLTNCKSVRKGAKSG